MNWIKHTLSCTVTVLLLTTAAVSHGMDQPSANKSQADETANASHEEKPNRQAAASVHFPEPNHEFEAVVEGIKATHDFIVQNKGTAVLKIKNVRTG